MGAVPLILSFDTATLGGSVCLARGEEILASTTGDPAVSHSNSLLRDINQILETAGIALGDVELFAAACGPGSFTGLRIGLATVKALSVSLNRPCAGIPTLHAIAHSSGPSEVAVAALPAGRGEVFTQLLSVSNDCVVTELDAPAHLPPRAMIEKYGELTDLKWTGEGAHLHQAAIRDGALGRNIKFVNESSTFTPGPGWVLAGREASLAEDIAALALQRFQDSKVETPQLLRAIYIRPSDAEIKQQCQ